MMFELPSWLDKIITGLGGAFPAAVIGRMMWHVRAVQIGKRRFWSMHLVWEIPVAICMALVADGAAEWLGLNGKAATAFIATMAYLGPHGIEVMFGKVVEQGKTGRK